MRIAQGNVCKVSYTGSSTLLSITPFPPSMATTRPLTRHFLLSWLPPLAQLTPCSCPLIYSCAHLLSHLLGYGVHKQSFRYLQIRKLRGHTAGVGTGTSLTERQRGWWVLWGKWPAPAGGKGWLWLRREQRKGSRLLWRR